MLFITPDDNYVEDKITKAWYGTETTEKIKKCHNNENTRQSGS
jgi:hypothetical protein